MDWLQSLDIRLFRLINQGCSNSFCDGWMPFLNGNDFFIPFLVVLGIALIWKGGTRGRLCVLFLLLAVVIGDGLICNSLKHAFGRPRPFNLIFDANVLVGRGKSGSMPSGHTTNWFAAAAVAFVYYRRSAWFLLPMAALIGFSRVYLGVHYPMDVLAGAILGLTCGLVIVGLADVTWRQVGKRWFPIWWEKLPSLLTMNPSTDPSPRPSLLEGERVSERNVASEPREALESRASIDQHWLRLGYIVIGFFLFLRLAYLASGTIELSEDEAYQWLWSKHLALSYFSKPPLIAYTQFLGTHLWGDTAFGVRFFSPVIAAIISFVLLRFLAREVNARLAFWFLLIMSATPLMAAGAVLMTIDPLSVLFWTLAMISGWRAVQKDSTAHWLWTGLWTGLGFLSKYTALFQLLSWAVFFALWPAARTQLRRRGPYLAVLVIALSTLPVLLWNAKNGWITVTHLANRGGLDRKWELTSRFLIDFVVAEAGLLNPVFFLAMLASAALFWRRYSKDGLLLYFFSMGAPLFLFYALYTLRARVQPNWIAPAVLPLFCLMAIYWERRLAKLRVIKFLSASGLIVGLTAVVFLHNTDLAEKIARKSLPNKYDPLVRVRGWRETASVIGEARECVAGEGSPAFIIADHYGITGQLSFYLPAAKEAVLTTPLVYYESSEVPRNQFYFWPGYKDRKGENAIYVLQTDSPKPPPRLMIREFESVTDLGMREIKYRGRVIRTVQLFACRSLR